MPQVLNQLSGEALVQDDDASLNSFIDSFFLVFERVLWVLMVIFYR